MKSAVAAGYVARQIAPLLERGRAAFVARMRGRFPEDIVRVYESTDLAIVTLDDAIAQPRLLFAYVARVKTVQVLDDEGELSILICPKEAA